MGYGLVVASASFARREETFPYNLSLNLSQGNALRVRLDSHKPASGLKGAGLE